MTPPNQCPSPSSVTIGLVQHRCTENLAQNMAAAKNGAREAAKRGAKIICLQELFHATYFCSKEDAAFFALAEPADGPIVSECAALARELRIVLIVPFFEKRAAGLFHNSAAVIDADGTVLGVYRKMHIPDDPLFYEKYYFTPGDAALDRSSTDATGYRAFKTAYGTIGVLICWDQWYPEAARITALCGAQIIFYPTAIGWHPKEKATFGAAQVQAWQTIQRSHAIANGVFVAAVNRVGHEPTAGTDGLEFFGRSFVTDPFGRTLCEDTQGEAAVFTTECNLGLIDETRQNWPFLRDRRIESYTPILSRYIAAK
jgi:N-carbamoylputrescine amidase